MNPNVMPDAPREGKKMSGVSPVKRGSGPAGGSRRIALAAGHPRSPALSPADVPEKSLKSMLQSHNSLRGIRSPLFSYRPSSSTALTPTTSPLTPLSEAGEQQPLSPVQSKSVTPTKTTRVAENTSRAAFEPFFAAGGYNSNPRPPTQPDQHYGNCFVLADGTQLRLSELEVVEEPDDIVTKDAMAASLSDARRLSSEAPQSTTLRPQDAPCDHHVFEELQQSHIVDTVFLRPGDSDQSPTDERCPPCTSSPRRQRSRKTSWLNVESSGSSTSSSSGPTRAEKPTSNSKRQDSFVAFKERQKAPESPVNDDERIAGSMFLNAWRQRKSQGGGNSTALSLAARLSRKPSDTDEQGLSPPQSTFVDLVAKLLLQKGSRGLLRVDPLVAHPNSTNVQGVSGLRSPVDSRADDQRTHRFARAARKASLATQEAMEFEPTFEDNFDSSAEASQMFQEPGASTTSLYCFPALIGEEDRGQEPTRSVSPTTQAMKSLKSVGSLNMHKTHHLRVEAVGTREILPETDEGAVNVMKINMTVFEFSSESRSTAARLFGISRWGVGALLIFLALCVVVGSIVGALKGTKKI